METLPTDPVQMAKTLLQKAHEARNLADKLFFQVRRETYLVASSLEATLKDLLSESALEQLEQSGISREIKDFRPRDSPPRAARVYSIAGW